MGKDRDREAIAAVDCPLCGSTRGRPCVDLGGQRLGYGRPMAHRERRQAWQATRPRDAVEQADILMSNQKARGGDSYLLLAPMTPRGRAALPDGATRIETPHVRETLARLRARGLIVMRED